jgi:FkbM family methyltransferase
MTVTRVNSDIGPYDLVLRPQDVISSIIRRDRQPYEQRVIAIVRELTRPGSLIVDVGANLGNHTVYWARAGRRVIAFEPNPVTRSALVKSVALNNLGALVDIRPVALGATPGTGTLRMLCENNEGMIAVEAASGGNIPIVRLDDLELRQAAVIKIDVEGAEESVLLGGRQTISRLRPFIISEMQESRSDGAAALLRDLGYHRISPSLAVTPTYLYASSFASAPAVIRSSTLIRTCATYMRRRISGQRTGESERIQIGRY